MKPESPYVLAEDTVNHVTDQCNRISEINKDSSDVERVQVLNYLRTVRTTIELMEYEIMKVRE
jgi:hypothetical protein